jgi:hypothetical protein
MMKVLLTWKLVVASLLCAFILTASLDRMPDPPAVKPHGSDAQLSNLNKYCDAYVPQDWRFHTYFSPAVSAVPWFDPSMDLRTKSRVRLNSLLRQASDTSPPNQLIVDRVL